MSAAERVCEVGTAALGELAEEASQWVTADDQWAANGTPSIMVEALNVVRDRICNEAATIPATIREGLRYKAQVLVRLERAALNDDASMSDAARGLLRSLLADLSGAEVMS